MIAKEKSPNTLAGETGSKRNTNIQKRIGIIKYYLVNKWIEPNEVLTLEKGGLK